MIHWTVVGDYSGDDLILKAGTNGYAPITDHVELSFDYTTEGNGGLTGTPRVTNFPSVVGAMRNGAVGCRPPTVSGVYERSTIEQLKDGFGGQITGDDMRVAPDKRFMNVQRAGWTYTYRPTKVRQRTTGR